MEFFWTHRENIPDGVGFGQFSVAHFLWIALMTILVVIISRIYKSSDHNQRITLRRTIATILMVSEVLKMIVIIMNGVDFTHYLPLEICSFAAYSIVCDSIWPEKDFFSQMLVTLFLPAAIMSIIFPTVTPLPAINFFTIHQFIYHGLIVAYVTARFSSGEIKIDYPGVWKSILKICVIAAIVYAIDILFNRTFMFLTDPYGNPLLDMIWGITGGGVPYTLGLVVFVIIVIHIFFLIFKGLSKFIKS